MDEPNLEGGEMEEWGEWFEGIKGAVNVAREETK